MTKEKVNNILKKSFICLTLIAIVLISGCEEKSPSQGWGETKETSDSTKSIVKGTTNLVAQKIDTIFTWNPVVYSRDPSNPASPAITALQPILFYIVGLFYTIMLIINGIYFIWGAISPATRAQCKERILKLIFSMCLVVVSPLILQLMLDLNNGLVSNIMNTAGIPVGSEGFINAVTVIKASLLVFITPFISLTSVLGPILVMLLILIIAPILIAGMRYLSLMVLAVFFPFIIFMYFNDLTKDIGARFIRITLVWTFTPVIMAIFFVVMHKAIASANLLSVAGITNGLIGLASFALMSIAPLMMSGMLNIVGSSFVHSGRVRGNPRLVFLGSLMMGYSASSFTQMAFQAAGTKSGLTGSRARASDRAQLEGFKKTAGGEVKGMAEQAPGPIPFKEKFRGFWGASLGGKALRIIFWSPPSEELMREDMRKYRTAQQNYLMEWERHRDKFRAGQYGRGLVGMGWAIGKSWAVSGFDVLRPMGDFVIGATTQVLPPGLHGRVVGAARRFTGYWEEKEGSNTLRWVPGETPMHMIRKSIGSIVSSPAKLGVAVGGVAAVAGALSATPAVGAALILTPIIAGAGISAAQQFGYGLGLSTDTYRTGSGRQELRENQLGVVNSEITRLSGRKREKEALLSVTDSRANPKEYAKLQKDISGIDSRISGLENKRDRLDGTLNKYDERYKKTLDRDIQDAESRKGKYQEELQKRAAEESPRLEAQRTELQRELSTTTDPLRRTELQRQISDIDSRIGNLRSPDTEGVREALRTEVSQERRQYSQHLDQEYLKKLDERILSGTATEQDQRSARNIEAIYGRQIHEILRDEKFMKDVGILSKEERRALGLPEEARITGVDKGLAALEGDAAKISKKVRKKEQLTPAEEQTGRQYNNLLAERGGILHNFDLSKDDQKRAARRAQVDDLEGRIEGVDKHKRVLEKMRASGKKYSDEEIKKQIRSL